MLVGSGYGMINLTGCGNLTHHRGGFIVTANLRSDVRLRQRNLVFGGFLPRLSAVLQQLYKVLLLQCWCTLAALSRTLRHVVCPALHSRVCIVPRAVPRCQQQQGSFLGL